MDEPLVWYEGAGVGAGSRRYLHADHQGSVIAVSDAAGAVLGVNRYDPYGVPSAGNIGRFSYTGQTRIDELGLYYYKARIYNPWLGRFMQTDPIGYDDDLNLYAYVGGDPVNGTDPSGLYVCEGGKSECGAIDGFVAGINAARANLDPQSDAFKKVDSVATLLGAPGEKNGVILKASSWEGSALARAGSAGVVSINVGKINAYAAKVQAANPGLSISAARVAVGAGAVAHEGRHLQDFKRNGFPTSKEAAYRAELNAYRTEQGVHKGLDVRTGLFQKEVGQEQLDRNVSSAAQQSVEWWCNAGGPCR